jgi:hypothetical protein
MLRVGTVRGTNNVAYIGGARLDVVDEEPVLPVQFLGVRQEVHEIVVRDQGVEDEG